MSQVPLERASLNSEDVFILDRGLKIHQWYVSGFSLSLSLAFAHACVASLTGNAEDCRNGAQASVFEKLRAGEVVRETISEREGRPTAHLHDEGDADCDEFWDAIGGKGPIAVNGSFLATSYQDRPGPEPEPEPSKCLYLSLLLSSSSLCARVCVIDSIAPKPVHQQELDHQGGIAKLFRLSDASGSLTFNLEHQGTRLDSTRRTRRFVVCFERRKTQ